MNNFEFAVNLGMNLFTWIVIIVGGFFLRSYLPDYFQEKGKNLATKEDVEEITEKVERIRAQYVANQEKLKADLQEASEILTNRRNLYENLVKSLGIFISGREVTKEHMAKFLEEYSMVWLWASDAVVASLKSFLDLQIAVACKPNSVDQEALKQAYTACILAMRRDSGFTDTQLRHDDYRFVVF